MFNIINSPYIFSNTTEAFYLQQGLNTIDAYGVVLKVKVLVLVFSPFN